MTKIHKIVIRIGESDDITLFLSEFIEFICRLVGYNLGVQVNSRIEFD